VANNSSGGSFLVHTLVVGVALWVAAYVVPGVHVSGLLPLAIGAIVLGLVNAAVRPILLILTLPITILTLGLFYFVVNGLAFGLAAALVPGFSVDSLWYAILGSIVVSLVSWLIGLITGN
jgi:putative membrane protein